MAFGSMGYGLSRFADRRAREAERDQRPQIEPLKPGEDPLAALDPETRALVLSLEPAAAPEDADPDFGDRLGGALMGAGVGGTIGFLVANWTPRYQRWSGAGPMNWGASAIAFGVGAAIGGIAGFAKGHHPLDRDPGEIIDRAVPGSSSPLLTPVDLSHPAFASLHG